MWRELVCRPVLAGFVGLLGGLSLGYSPWFGWAVLLLLFGLRTTASAGWLSGFFLAGFLARPVPEPIVRVEGGSFQGRVIVASVPSVSRSGMSCLVKAENRLYGLRLPPGSTLNLGDRAQLTARIRPISDPRFRSRGEVGWLEPLGPIEATTNPFPLWRWGSALRGSFLGFLERFAEPRLYGLIAALCFNVTSDLSADLSDKLSRCGLIHLISTGGLHIFLVAGAVAWLLSQMPISRGWQLAILLGLVVIYAAAAGFRPPMVRSLVMIALFLSAYLFRREPDGLTLLSMAGIAYLVWSPESVANVGFQLSFLAVGGLLLFARATPLGDNPTLLHVAMTRGKDLAKVSLIATLVTAPAVVYHFQRLPIVAPLTNLLVVPVVTPVIVGALASWLVHSVSPAIAVGLLKVVVEPLAAWMLLVTEQIGGLPFSAVEFAPVPAGGAALATFLIFTMWRPRRRTVDE